MATVETPRESGALIASRLRDLTPRDGIVSDAVQLAAWAIDGVVPACAVSPSSAAEVAEILKLCSANDWTVVPAGGFSMQGAGRQLASCDVLLRTDRLNRVVFYDPGDLTIGLGAGVTVAEQRAMLGEHKQWLPLPRRSAARSTLGGVAATSITGPPASAFGGVREFCIGVQFVTGEGKIARGGGRVVKNVAGYDLMKLMIGSYGTLGVMTELNFKVFPAPIATRSYLVERPTHAEIVAERDRLLATRLSPMCLEAISPYAQEVLENAAVPRNPDDYAPAGKSAAESKPWLLALRASGTDAVLARYKRELGADAVEFTGEADDEFWREVEDYPDRLAAQHRNAALLQVACTTEQVELVLRIAGTLPLDCNLLPAIVGRAAMGSLLVGLIPLAVDPPAASQFAKAVNGLRTSLPPGVLVNVLRMPVEAKAHCDPWDTRGADTTLMGNIKRALDPAGILNRGRYIV